MFINSIINTTINTTNTTNDTTTTNYDNNNTTNTNSNNTINDKAPARRLQLQHRVVIITVLITYYIFAVSYYLAMRLPPDAFS